jgi:hypothetical protein
MSALFDHLVSLRVVRFLGSFINKAQHWRRALFVAYRPLVRLPTPVSPDQPHDHEQ